MKKLVVSLVVVMFCCMNVFAINQRPGNAVQRDNISWQEFIEGYKIDSVFESALLMSRTALANASIFSDEVANSVIDNAGNYNFFTKQGSNSGDVEDRAGLTMYIKALGGQEKLDMKDMDSKSETMYYGATIGLDTDRQYSDNFDATYGIFASYINSELKNEDYDSAKAKQQAGYIGVRGNWYLGKLFFGAVVDYGMISNKLEDTDSDVSTDFTSQNIGLTAKAGYNFEVAEKSFTVQPNVVFNGNYLMTEDYDNIGGSIVKNTTEDMINLAVAPGLKLAKTLGKCWILSAEGKYVFVSSTGDAKMYSDAMGFETTLPDTYYKDYVSCGIGIEKIWGYTVLHLKGNKTFCGRDGYVVNAGIEFKF